MGQAILEFVQDALKKYANGMNQELPNSCIPISRISEGKIDLVFGITGIFLRRIQE
jgi:hypothetical protein